MKKYFTLSILLVISLISISQTNHVVNTIANSFNPSNLIIAVGDTVTWTNTGGMHNVNGNQSTFASNPASFGNSLGTELKRASDPLDWRRPDGPPGVDWDQGNRAGPSLSSVVWTKWTG